MRVPRQAWIAPLCALVLLTGGGVTAEEDGSLHNTEIYESPWKGETPSKGTYSTRHEGEGEPPKEGYFKKHDPGEVAEFHLFVPDGLEQRGPVPLLIVYHGGKDGASGKAMCRRFSRISTTDHPVIVLSPNMYTMDAYNELLDEGKLPIDTRRVVVYGHSSGGMGVRSAMAEYVRSARAFLPAALISSSTTASLGRAEYPPCPYYVMAGENETPAFVTNEILKNRRRTCRVHALTMQQFFREVRYIEAKGTGHAGGTPAHMGVIQHAIAVSEREPVVITAESRQPVLQPLLAAARTGAWVKVREEIERLDDSADLKPRAEYEKLRGKVIGALERWFEAEVRALARLTPKASYADRDRGFLRHDRLQTAADAFADTAVGKTLAGALATLSDGDYWRTELAARRAYLEIVGARPSAAMKEKLNALRAEAPTTEYARNRTREKLLALGVIQAQTSPDDLPDGPAIHNPYYPNAKWRVWRDDETPIENVRTVVREGKKKVAGTLTLAPTEVAKRIYPDGPLRDGKPIRWKTLATPSKQFAGVWDDVYASWSGLHGYVRSTWQATDGSTVCLRPKGIDHIMHFVEVQKTSDLLRCGINFVHQSTTGMSHTITNGYNPKMATTYEKIYFSDCLVTAPAHASYTEDHADRTKDMILALVPTLFNSVGSSNSETMAITKMMIAGGYLPPESKRLLKRSGLYPSALLYIWKASLPFEVPYDHELRHRVAYRSLGDERQFSGKYGHAGSERGNLSLEYHRYDEIAHMRNMIRMAESMRVLPPEAILDEVTVEGGRAVYLLKKTALILQEEGQEVTVRLSTAKCYDLDERPLTVRWKLLYGTRGTTCVPGEEPDTWILRVPWDAALPEGRTAIALFANNGVHDGNPAIINVFRKHADLPPPGVGRGGYSYDPARGNRRPVLLGLQDQVVKPGRKVEIPLAAVDPEGQAVRFYKRAGDPGELRGNVLTLKVPRGTAAKNLSATIIASDGTAGNSYAAKRVNFVVSPKAHAHIECEAPVGTAPFTVTASSKGSLPSRGKKVEWGWEFYAPTARRKPADWKKLSHEQTATHTFEKPGLYEVALTVKNGEATDRETIQIWVTDGPPPAPIGGVVVEGNGVRIADGDDAPCSFNATLYGTVKEGGRRTRRFELFNQGDTDVLLGRGAITLTGPNAEEFRVAMAPARRVGARGSTSFDISFRPKGAGPRTAEVRIRAGKERIGFSVAGTGTTK